ncbi:hypothetical protein D3C80_2014510 [compost metagenome]
MTYLYAIIFERKIEQVYLFTENDVRVSPYGFITLMNATARQRAEAGYLLMVDHQPLFRRTLLFLEET